MQRSVTEMRKSRNGRCMMSVTACRLPRPASSHAVDGACAKTGVCVAADAIGMILNILVMVHVLMRKIKVRNECL